MEMGAGGRTLDGDTVRLWDRIAGAAGVVFVVLLLLGLLTPQTPTADTLAQVIGDRLETDHLGHEMSIFLALAGVGFFLIFLAGVWSRLRRSEGGGGMFAGLFVIGGAIFAAIVLVSEGFHLALLKAATGGRRRGAAGARAARRLGGFVRPPRRCGDVRRSCAEIGTSQAFPTWLGLASGAVAVVLVFSAVQVFDEGGGDPRFRRHRRIPDDQRIGAGDQPSEMLHSGDGPNDPA